MDWYIVIKTINGHRYYYRQKTWREGARVRTHSQYIGPAGPAEFDPTPRAPRKTTQRELTQNAETEAFSLVTGDASEDWQHAFDGGRNERSVKRVREVDDVLKALEISWKHETRGAFYRPRTDEVNIPPARCFFDTEKQSATSAYYIVTFHEVVHWTARRIPRTAGMGGMAYAREELVAELGAVMLMKHFGIEIGDEGRHAHYFQFWLGRAGARERALAHARAEASKAVNFILERGTLGHA